MRSHILHVLISINWCYTYEVPILIPERRICFICWIGSVLLIIDQMILDFNPMIMIFISGFIEMSSVLWVDTSFWLFLESKNMIFSLLLSLFLKEKVMRSLINIGKGIWTLTTIMLLESKSNMSTKFHHTYLP